jgi:hypothetical protein
MTITITGLGIAISNIESEATRLIKSVGDETFADIVPNTPIRTGNARRNWSETVTPKAFQIKNTVPYIERLEAGYSKQAPKGMVGPTLTQVKGKFK